MKARRLVPSEQGSGPGRPSPAGNNLSQVVETWARDLIWQLDASAARSVQTTIGPSEIGSPCTRRLAYTVNAVEPIQANGGSLSAVGGTGLHKWLADRVDAIFGNTHRYLTECSVEYRGIRGTCDLFDRQQHRVVDWKTKDNAAAVNRLFRKADPWTPNWIVQTNIYGAAVEATLQEPVEEVSIVLIPRSGRVEDIRALVRPFDKTIADAAIDRLLEIQETRPEDAAPVTSGLCYSCPFYRNARLGIDLPTGCPGPSTT